MDEASFDSVARDELHALENAFAAFQAMRRA